MDYLLFLWIGVCIFLIGSCIQRFSSEKISQCRQCNQILDLEDSEEVNNSLCKSCVRKRKRMLQELKMQKKV